MKGSLIFSNTRPATPESVQFIAFLARLQGKFEKVSPSLAPPTGRALMGLDNAPKIFMTGWLALDHRNHRLLQAA